MNNHPNATGPIPILNQPIYQLVIRYDPNTKQVTVNGPVNDTILALAMLEMAKLIVIEQHFRANVVLGARALPPQ